MTDDRAEVVHPVDVEIRPPASRVITVLFFTEAWERFSFFGMRAILLFYLYYPPARGGLGLPTPTALVQVSAYAALIYLSGAAGGWVADRVCGARRATLFGGLSIAAGHLLIAVCPNLTATYTGLLLIAAGTGLVKTNVSVLVGAAYEASERSRRIAGFALFYVGVSLGGFVGPIVVGWFQQEVSFPLAFGVTGVGMLLGLLCFVGRWNSYAEITRRPPHPLPAGAYTGRRARSVWAAVVGLALLIGISGQLGLLDGDVVVNLITWAAVPIAVNYVRLLVRHRGTTAESRARVRGFVPVLLAGAVFALLANQMFSSLALFAASRVDTTILGWSFPAAWLPSAETAGIMLFGPVLSWWWSRRNTDVDPGHRTARALALAGVAFLVIALGASVAGYGEVSMAWIVPAYLMLAFCDATIGSTGLAAASQLGQARQTSQGLGLWFLGSSVGNGIGAQLVTSFDAAQPVRYFATTGAGTILVALVLAWYARYATSSHRRGDRA